MADPPGFQCKSPVTVGKAKALSFASVRLKPNTLWHQQLKAMLITAFHFLLLSGHLWHLVCVDGQWLMHTRLTAEVSTSDPL
jgi:hypothetical protein